MYLSRLRRLIILVPALVAVVLASSIPPAAADDVPIADRRYELRVVKIRSVDETGYPNWLGSDEVYGGFKTNFEGQWQGVETPFWGNFDAGETRYVPNDRNCLSRPNITSGSAGFNGIISARGGDRWGCGVAIAAPFNVRVKLWESDPPPFPCSFPCEFAPAPVGDPLGRESSSDDYMGEGYFAFSQQGLAGDVPNVWDSREFTTSLTEADGHYDVTFRVTRRG